jgi:hypothetical protein
VHEQRVEPQADRSAIVDATVAGIVEATRWVLSWVARLERWSLRRS